MPRTQIFISYRRDDTAGYARAVYDELAQRYGAERVFIDVDDINAGQPFSEVIERALDASAVLLVLIGKRWKGERDGGMARVDEPDDLVRREVAAGLSKGMHVIPVLLDGAAMPTEAQLPEVLRPLAGRNAIELHNTRFSDDIKRLKTVLDNVVGRRKPMVTRRKTPRWWGWAAAAAIIAAAGALWFMRSGGDNSMLGVWQAEVVYDWPNARHLERYAIGSNGGTLYGTASYLGTPRGMLDVHVDGSKLSFVTKTSEITGGSTSEVVHRYSAQRMGDELRFVMQSEGGSVPHEPVSFVAKKVAANAAELNPSR